MHFRQGQAWLRGRVRELPSPLAAQAAVGADGIGAAALTYSAEPASAQALVMCQGHTLKYHWLGKGKPKSVNRQEIWWSRRLLNTNSWLVSIRCLEKCLSKKKNGIPSAQWQGRAAKTLLLS